MLPIIATKHLCLLDASLISFSLLLNRPLHLLQVPLPQQGLQPDTASCSWSSLSYSILSV